MVTCSSYFPRMSSQGILFPEVRVREGELVPGIPLPGQIYQIRITLIGSQLPIWRRIQIRADTTLSGLHEILQVVMGWSNAHLHRFIVHGKSYEMPEGGFEGSENQWDERNFSLHNLLSKEGSRMTYEYDFGDDWQHEIAVEEICPAEENTQYPFCLEGAGACPPEDVGGVPGYADFLAAVEEPNHPEHQSYLDWVGGSFDPQKFDCDEVNQTLRGIP